VKKRPTDELPEFADQSEILNSYFGFVEGLKRFNNPKCRPWLEMCIACDENRDFAPLLELMQSGAPAEVMSFVRDLFERHGLIKGVRGNLQRTPLYRDTSAEAHLAMACEDVAQLQQHAITVEEAIDVVARWHSVNGITTNSLANAVKGSSPAMRRGKERVEQRKCRRRWPHPALSTKPKQEPPIGRLFFQPAPFRPPNAICWSVFSVRRLIHHACMDSLEKERHALRKLRPSGFAPADLLSYTIPEWCALRRVSRGSLYNMWQRGEGPDRTECGARVTITKESDAKWVASKTTNDGPKKRTKKADAEPAETCRAGTA